MRRQIKTCSTIMLVLMLSMPTLVMAQPIPSPRPLNSSTSTTVTLTGKELSEVVDRACRAAREKAKLIPSLELTADQLQRERDRLEGQLIVLRDVDAKRRAAQMEAALWKDRAEERWSTFTIVVVTVGSLVAGAGLGYLVGIALP